MQRYGLSGKVDIGKILQHPSEVLPGVAVGDLNMASNVEWGIDHKHICSAVALVVKLFS